MLIKITVTYDAVPVPKTQYGSVKTQTVKAGKSTINIRDDGSTIHYGSNTGINLFDFLDFLSGKYGPNNEMAESVQHKKDNSVIPDLLAKGNPLAYTLIEGVDEAAEKTTEMAAAKYSPLQISMNLALDEVVGLAFEKIPADKLIDAVKSETGKHVIYDFLESNNYVITKEAMEYVTNYIVDTAINNPDTEFSIAELLAEISKAYIEEDIIED